MTDKEATPTTPSEELILLRFPEHLRAEAGLQHSSPPRASSIHPARRTAPPKRPRRWLRGMIWLTFLTLCTATGALAVGLEQEYRLRRGEGQQLAALQHKLADVKKRLATSQSSRIYLSLPTYLNHLDQSVTGLRQSQSNHCQRPPSAPFVWRWPRTFGEWKQRWQQLRRWSWERLRSPYLTARRWALESPAPPTKAQHQALCRTSPTALLAELRQRLQRSSQRLLTEATRHLRFYGWCTMRWARFQEDPTHRPWLDRLRERRCRASCRRGTNAACRTCLTQWRLSLSLPQKKFQTYYELVRGERQRRCLHWIHKTKAPAHRGVYHLGEYFWRVRRVLSYGEWLEKHQLCDKACQTQRKTWGFRLELTTKKEAANVHVQLWPEARKAPTSWLRQLARQPLGKTNEGPLWLPALRTDLLKEAPPRQLWMLLLVVAPRSHRSALLPLAPEAGRSLKQTLPLQAMEIYNDGRHLLRFPRFSSDGGWLAFVTLRQPSWSSPLRFADPTCWKPPTAISRAPSWRSALSLYPMDARARPTSQGQHRKTHAVVRHLALHGSREDLTLWVSSSVRPRQVKDHLAAPQSQAPTPANPNVFGGSGSQPNVSGGGGFAGTSPTDAAPLWKLPFRPEQTPAFGEAQAVTQAQAQTVDIPFPSPRAETSVLRLRCPLPSSLSLLQRDTNRPDFVPIPQGFRLFAGASSRAGVSLLLQNAAHNHPALLRLPRPLTDRSGAPQQLARAFRQVQESRGVALLAGGEESDPVVAYAAQGRTELLAGQRQVRYLDPVIHWPSRRLFVVQHWEIPGSTRWKPTATFLISVPLPQSFATPRR